MALGAQLVVTLAHIAENLAAHQQRVFSLHSELVEIKINAERSISESKALMRAADAVMARDGGASNQVSRRAICRETSVPARHVVCGGTS